MRKIGLIASAGILIFQGASAQMFPAPAKDFPGTIPLQSERQAASDLYDFGLKRELQPDEAREMAAKKLLKNAQGQIVGLDELDPDPNSSVWKKFSSKLHWRGSVAAEAPINDLGLLGLSEQGEELEFQTQGDSPVETYHFTASKMDASGKLKIYQIILDPKGHNMLLRKALLRRLGYIIPPTDRLATVRIKFKNSLERKDVAMAIGNQTFRKHRPWLLKADIENTDTYLDMQDVIVTEGPNDRIYNFARGDMSIGVPQGRRLFNALLVPFSLTDSPESVNLQKWLSSKIFNNQLVLPHADAAAFANISYEDARWITRKILKLDRKDWEEIFAATKAPKEVTAVWMEKVLYNRNFLLAKLNFHNEFKPIQTNNSPSMGTRLKNGNLSAGAWPGYARKWSDVAPESPKSKEEMMGLVKSMGASSLIKSAVAKITSNLPKTDIAWKQTDHLLDLQVAQFLEYLETKEVKPIPRRIWKTKYFDLDLGISRELVTGGYVGTELGPLTFAQIADSIFVGVEGGYFYSKDGLPAKQSFSGHLKGWWVKSYTHVKPIQSTKMFFKEPFRNMYVKYYLSHAGHPLEDITKLQPAPGTVLSDEDSVALTEKVKEKMADFNTRLSAGESVILSNSWGPEFDLTLNKAVSGSSSVYVYLRDRFTVMDRMQVYRKDENTVQVYIDPAAYNLLGVGLGLSAEGLPIIRFGWNWTKGLVTTHFYEFNINPDLNENPKFFDNIWSVAAALRGADQEYFDNAQKNHWQVKHKPDEKSLHLDVLFGRLKTSSSTDEINITDKSGKTTEYVRRSQGVRTGLDFQTLAFDVATMLMQKKFPNAAVSAANSGNPADTYKGSSTGRNVIFEVEETKATTNNPSAIRWDNIYGSIRYAWKGWDAKNRKIKEIAYEAIGLFGNAGVINQYSSKDKKSQVGERCLRINQEDRKAIAECYADVVQNLADAQKIEFYTVDVQLSLYQEALKSIARLTDEKVDELFKYYQKRAMVSDVETTNGWAVAMKGDLKALRKAIQSGNRKEITERYADIIDVAENQLEFRAFLEMVGGIQNVFVRGGVRGFRVGAEDPRSEITFMTMGQVGSHEADGPLMRQQQVMGISLGEGLISWLINPLM